MLNPRTKRFEKELLDVADIKEEQFGRFVFPGEPIGVLTEEVQKITGLGAIPVIAVAGHDTGSAVAAVPAQNERFAYLSSGTWSLMGIEVKDAIINKESFEQNFTNEGGVEGTTRFLKNICGMWLLERCRKEWEATNNYSYTELIDAALTVPAFRSLIIRLFATNGPVPHRKAAHYRWRLTKQSVKPVHLQCSGRTCYSRSQ